MPSSWAHLPILLAHGFRPHVLQIAMAEIVGIALGVAGLAGLIGTFKDTIELFGLLTDTRHVSRQLEILDTRLDIEKLLLLQWADRVRLLYPDYDKRLDNPDTRRLVLRILAIIRFTLSDADTLRQSYGLRDVDQPLLDTLPAGDNSATERLITAGVAPEMFALDEPILPLGNGATSTSSAPTQFRQRWRISQARMGKFTKALQRKTETEGQGTSAHRRARWIISDKEKFQLLIQDLEKLVSKLDSIVPAAPGDAGSLREVARGDLAPIRDDIDQLSIVVEASSGRRRGIAQSAKRIIDETCQGILLDTLWFRKISDRRESISPHHHKTLRWALEPNTNKANAVCWDDLPSWLRRGSGTYWLSGKAGSGKSTLMKYIYSSPVTNEYLSEWASGERLLLCHFFFSGLGSDEERTLEGMSRSLLYQILKENPSLIQNALPGMWKEVLENASNRSKGIHAVGEIALPTPAEIRFAFKHISNSVSITGNICVFIDGPDEFHGDYQDGISFVQSLAGGSHGRIKILVSSRPIPACVAAFGGLPRLQLQDLTQQDIQKYVEDTVGSHSSMKRHRQRQPEASRALLQELVQKSCGVFLWVILACRSILDGFNDYDRLSEIRRRVDELPPELEDMFTHMLGKVNKRHTAQGAQLLSICHTYHGEETPFLRKDLLVLGLALFQEYETDVRSSEQLSFEDRLELCEEFEGRLRSRCGGLLELAHDNNALDRSINKGGQDIVTAKVVFMHRTVFEFLGTPEAWKMDSLQLGQNRTTDSMAALSLYHIHMATASLRLSKEINAMDHFEEGLWWGVTTDKQAAGNPQNCLLHLTAFFDTLQTHPPRFSKTLKALAGAVSQAAPYRCRCVGLTLASQIGASDFVQRQHRLMGDALATCACKTYRNHWGTCFVSSKLTAVSE